MCFWCNCLRGFVPHSVRNTMHLIALDLDTIWLLNRAIFDFQKRNFAFEHGRAQGEHARAQPNLGKNSPCWGWARPCSSPVRWARPCLMNSTPVLITGRQNSNSRSTARVPYEHGRAGQGARPCSTSARPCWSVQRAWLILNAPKPVLMIKLYLFCLNMLKRYVDMWDICVYGY